MSKSFNIFLPSNTKGYADNKTSSFRVRLPKKIILEGDWQCGLGINHFKLTT